jgi:NADH:ubiquinone oxidoreductase subunit K
MNRLLLSSFFLSVSAVIASSPLNKKKLNLVVVIAVSVTGALSGVALILYVYHLRRKLKAQLYGKITYPEIKM